MTVHLPNKQSNEWKGRDPTELWAAALASQQNVIIFGQSWTTAFFFSWRWTASMATVAS